MKIFLFVLFCVLLISCKKNNEVNKGAYLGKWELTETISNGVIGLLHYEKGNGNTVSFENNGNFTQTIVSADTSYSNIYTYTLEMGNGCETNQSLVPILKLSNGQMQIATIEDTLLSLRPRDCIDLYVTSVYRKLN